MQVLRSLTIASVFTSVFAGLIAIGDATSPAQAAPCPGNPDAIGTGRVITIDPKDHSRLGLMQYRYSLPLNDREVVLTFDDGPLPPYTDHVLKILARHCVRATFFLVGRHAAANPDAVLRIYDAGHTIGNHSQNHVLHFDQISNFRAQKEIENGNRTLNAILGRANHIAPFFRVPGLGRTRVVEQFAKARSLVVWSADAVADDWTRITANQVLRRALSRLEARRRGILLLHDIQPRTVLMLPALLAELKRRGFTIVHVVAKRDGDTAPPAALVASKVAPKLGWPRVAAAGGAPSLPLQRLPELASSPAAPQAVSAIERSAVRGGGMVSTKAKAAVAAKTADVRKSRHRRKRALRHAIRPDRDVPPDPLRAVVRLIGDHDVP